MMSNAIKKIMVRLFFSICLLAGFTIGGWLLWDSSPRLQEFAKDKLQTSELRTLEIRYTAEQVMERHKKDLIKGAGYSFLEPRLLFYPYLMMNTKFTTDQAHTREGTLLWGMTDGEMVLDTAHWKKTHGFEDCLLSKAGKNDFKILRAIVEAGGSIDRERLYQKFKTDGEMIDKWINHCRAKNLIVSSGAHYRLHLQNPSLENIPITLMHEPLVAHPTRYAVKSKKRYSVSQISKLAHIAFGPDFSIRHMEQIFLPVYSIGVQNPDGSVFVTYWNALNGTRFTQLSP